MSTLGSSNPLGTSNGAKGQSQSGRKGEGGREDTPEEAGSSPWRTGESTPKEETSRGRESRRRGNSLEKRRRSRPKRSCPGGVGYRTKGDPERGRLLWVDNPSGGKSEEDREGGWRAVCQHGVEWHKERTDTSGPGDKPHSAVCGARVPDWVCIAGERGPFPSWSEGQVGAGREQRGSLDQEPGRGRRSRRRQVGRTTAAKGKSARTRSSGHGSGRRRRTTRRRRSRRRSRGSGSRQGEIEEEEKEEGERQEVCEARRQETYEVRPEELAGSVWRDRPGPSREGSKKSAEDCEKVCGKEEAGLQQQQDFILELGGVEHQRGASWWRRDLQRREQGQGDSRALPGGFVLRGHPCHEEYSDDRSGRGGRRIRPEAHSHQVLPPAPSEESLGGNEQGSFEHSHCLRSPPEGETQFGSGLLGPAPKIQRGNSQWIPLERGSTDGAANPGDGHHHPEVGVASSSQGELCRVKDILPGLTGGQRFVPRREGQEGKRRRQGRKECRREGKVQRRTSKSEGRIDVEERASHAVSGEEYEDRSRAEDAPRTLSEDVKISSCLHKAGSEDRGEVFMNPDLDTLKFQGQGHRDHREGDPIFSTRPFLHDPEVEDISGDAAAEFHDSTGSSRLLEEKDGGVFDLGMTVKRLGNPILQTLLEVLPLRSQTMGGEGTLTVFPLPTSRDVLLDVFSDLNDDDLGWLISVCVSLNIIWGDEVFSAKEPSTAQLRCLVDLVEDVKRMRVLDNVPSTFDWSDFCKNRRVDYQGDEVKIAQYFCWGNIAPALPKEVGKVSLESVCTLGTQYYVNNFDLFIKPRESWAPVTRPKVMVKEEDWSGVCRGLVDSGVCCYLKSEDVFELGDQGLLLNGLFGVTKDEISGGHEVFRLIMNLIPLNGIAEGLGGDIQTLPSWAMMNPLFLQPNENLLVSSEDVRCFFYIMAVPPCWTKYLAFNKVVPQEVLPEEMKGGTVYLASRVLPMGFVNSVSIAQHVHRNLILASDQERLENLPENELRKDRTFPSGNPLWRVYLDNYDLLERVEATQMVSVIGSSAPGVLAVRHEYEKWEVPRNVKKAVARSPHAEVQGAQVDGERGVAFPREAKLVKYVSAGLSICQAQRVSQRQMQVVCGGLVYLSMFRRPLLGCLNQVWRFIESFQAGGPKYKELPAVCKIEICRVLGLVPLARMDFRLDFHRQVTCSDASSSGGGICSSVGLTPYGVLASKALLRGERPEGQHDHRVLSVGLFDGIGALRVALDLLEVEVIGHVSVEVNPHASRVVEAHFPGSLFVSDVSQVDEAMVRSWALQFSQASIVILGGGPPCQGVSGLNCDRKGAMKDSRSALFFHVKRVKVLVVKAMPWCQVHVLMESVASMDQCDKDIMSDDIEERPWECDAGTFTWCSRPRLYWVTWELEQQDGVEIFPDSSGGGSVVLHASQHLDQVCKEGYTKVDHSRPFPTFTTSRPRTHPGRKPAGIHQCTDEEIGRWVADLHRFPPYQYAGRNCLVGQRGNVRIPAIEEREVMMGFPLNYTDKCVPKSNPQRINIQDMRLTLIGNSWSVPVVAWFLGQLLAPRGLCRPHHPQAIIDKLNPANSDFLQAKLLRLPLRPLRGAGDISGEVELGRKLGGLISLKGEDLMLSHQTQDQVRYHRLRASVPSKLWRWKVVTGWKWKGKGEHINSLEMRAILSTLKWRIIHQGHHRCRFLHLTDSLVCLHCLSRGRSSSRKLRRTVSRINALLLVSSSQPLWGYVHTEQNPADKPSRWGRKVKTKFRNV